jgi:predicted Zn-dependent peptidase
MRAAACTLAVALACGPRTTGSIARDAPVAWGMSGIDWTKPPPLAAPVPFAPRVPETMTLPNGVRVIVLEAHRLPLVAVSIVHAGAGSRFDADKHGLAGLTAELLDDGAGQRTREQLRDALELAGARYTNHIATDYATMHVVVPSAQLEPALGVVASMVTAPKLAPADVERVRRERVAEIDERRQRPRTIAAQVFDRIVFGNHPYAIPADGDPHIVSALTAGDVRAFWVHAYRPELTTIILAGDVRTADARRIVETTLGAWTPGPIGSTGTAGAAARNLGSYAAQIALVDMPVARQSVVLIGKRAPAAGDRRQLVDDVASSIVGGGLDARLDRELHARLGLTLGASASYWRGRWAGSWTAAMTFSTAKTLEGIRAALRVIDETRTAIGDDELARARRDLGNGARLSFDTAASTARAIERLVVQDLPLDWYATYEKRLAAITVDEVRAASTWQELSIVVVGDRTKLEPALRELGLPMSVSISGSKR